MENGKAKTVIIVSAGTLAPLGIYNLSSEHSKWARINACAVLSLRRMENTIQIYTDGGASGNPGPGGLGIVLLFGNKKKEISRGFRMTTNNRMELLAVITALETLKTTQYPVVIYSDSKYVTEAVNQGWVFGWEKKQFDKKANPDLWMRFLPLYRKYKPKFVWVKGHAENVYNNRCDELAVAAYKKKVLEIDSAFENTQAASKGSIGF